MTDKPLSGSAVYLAIRPFNHSPQLPAIPLARSILALRISNTAPRLKSRGRDTPAPDVAETITTTAVPPPQMTSPNAISTDWLASQVRDRLQSRIAAGHPWKQLLQAASQETLQDVSRTLQAYTRLWHPIETSGIGAGASFPAQAAALELCRAAEQDLERGLSFVREVEKGSHMPNDAVVRFRPEAIQTVCELCRDGITVLQPRRGGIAEGDGTGGDGEHEELQQEERGEGAGRARALETANALIGTVYRRAEPQVKTAFQVLVHRHKNKKRAN